MIRVAASKAFFITFTVLVITASLERLFVVVSVMEPSMFVGKFEIKMGMNSKARTEEMEMEETEEMEMEEMEGMEKTEMEIKMETMA
ncbi:hypothetical protein Tco_1112757 [Tanacetum coccineum]|uniref:Uncharacterized protein n=1 Tax=Tanacetum coccineum TaxID=301880 RepID=A0ABQ5IQK0_9ASTR